MKGSTLPSASTDRLHAGAIVVSPGLRGLGDATHVYAACGVLLPPRRAIAMGGSTKIPWMISAM